MPRAIPILIIVGLAIYSFFDVLQTADTRLRRGNKTTWLVVVLIPVLGAAAWFLAGRPQRSHGGYGPPRVISLRGSDKPVAPDDDPAFLRRLEEEAWRRRREQQRRDQAGRTPDGEQGTGPAEPGDETDPKPPRRPNEGPAPSGPPGIAPAG